MQMRHYRPLATGDNNINVADDKRWDSPKKQCNTHFVTNLILSNHVNK